MIPVNYTGGKYAVGTSTFTIVDNSRKDTLGKGGLRKIAVRMYYPLSRESVKGAEKAPAMSDRKAKAVARSLLMRKLPEEMIFPEHYEIPMMEGKRFPLIMFSHGYGSYVEANTFLCCDLASRGYMIASLGHANEAIENDYGDGTFDMFDKQINKKMYSKNVISVLIAQNNIKKYKTARDTINAFDEFQKKYTVYIKDRVKEWAEDTVCAADVVKERYAEHIDLSAGIGASGHSLGGCTAYYLCRYNSEFSCGINIDGALFGDYDDTPMTKPFCQISCRENILLETRPFLNTTADTYQVIFDDMQHPGFTDVKFVFPFRSVLGKLDDEVLHRNLVYSHYAFFDRYLKGKDISFGRRSGKVHYVKIR